MQDKKIQMPIDQSAPDMPHEDLAVTYKTKMNKLFRFLDRGRQKQLFFLKLQPSLAD